MTPVLYWLSYRSDEEVTIFLVEAAYELSARVKAGLAGMDHNKFVESHALPEKMAKKVPPSMIGRSLSGKEAAALLKKLEG